ncbi:hypothetical protein FOWG_06412 [Fusarium oxysporum f. sp. lycopersici MN25]|nr:hypothetical protein FOWG_06412 [Fusarium oxysporum f. sp. lycopersici MN25]
MRLTLSCIINLTLLGWRHVCRHRMRIRIITWRHRVLVHHRDVRRRIHIWIGRRSVRDLSIRWVCHNWGRRRERNRLVGLRVALKHRWNGICSISCRIRRLPLDTSNLRVTHVSSSGILTASASGQASTAVATSSVVHRCCFCCCCFCNRRAEMLTTMKLTEKKKKRGRRERRG